MITREQLIEKQRKIFDLPDSCELIDAYCEIGIFDGETKYELLKLFGEILFYPVDTPSYHEKRHYINYRLRKLRKVLEDVDYHINVPLKEIVMCRDEEPLFPEEKQPEDKYPF